MSVNVGADTHPRVIARLLDDYSALTDGAVHLAEANARHRAERRVSDAYYSAGLRGLRGLASEREIDTRDLDLRDLDFADEEWEMFFHDFWRGGKLPPSMSRRMARRWYAASLGQTEGVAGLGSPLAELTARLVASETARNSADNRFTLRRFTYENPSVAEIVAAGGAAAGGLGYLLRVLSTLGARHRDAADQERFNRRARRSAAYDFEHQVSSRAEARNIMLEQSARGELDVRPEDFTDGFLDPLVGAMDRLGQAELAHQRLQLPSGNDRP
jgi:hypothetical protein